MTLRNEYYDELARSAQDRHDEFLEAEWEAEYGSEAEWDGSAPRFHAQRASVRTALADDPFGLTLTLPEEREIARSL